MKKLLGVLTLLVLSGLLSTMALAADASCYPYEAYAGTQVIVLGFEDKNGKSPPEEGTAKLRENYTISAEWTKSSGSYISSLAINRDGDVVLTIDPNLTSSKEKEITGTITLREKRPGTGVYTAVLRDKALLVNKGGKDNALPLIPGSGGVYELPPDYDTYRVSFKTSDGQDFGKFSFDFGGIATYSGMFLDQESLFLGYSTASVSALTNKYPSAGLQFISWTGKPKFNRIGTLSLDAYDDEYVYEIAADGTLKNADGKYNRDTGYYEIRTNTLGSYVISDIKLSTVAAGSSSSVPPSSSSAPPPSSSSAPPPSSSAPPPSSSSVPEPPSVSEPESIPEPEPEPQPPARPAPPKKTESKFPLAPALLGVGTLLVVILLFVLLGGQKSGKRPRFEDWDD